MRTASVGIAGPGRVQVHRPRQAVLRGGWRRLLLVGLLLVAPGCADCRFLAQTCPQPPDPHRAAQVPAPNPAYRIGCPDVLLVSFADHPEWDALAAVDLDGCLPLEALGRLRVEGRTLPEVQHELAQRAALSPDRVAVHLAAPRTSRIYLHGPIRGHTRIVPYQGPEPVIDFLQRVGGLPPGSKLNEVYVVRPNVAAGCRPEVFPVDVAAVLIDHNPATNIPLQPSDAVYVGETRRSAFARLLPDWLGPMYRRLIGLLPDEWWPWSRSRWPQPPQP